MNCQGRSMILLQKYDYSNLLQSGISFVKQTNLFLLQRDPLRIFYESLYEQIPTSDMAATW
jgi:hypothetical protein